MSEALRAGGSGGSGGAGGAGEAAGGVSSRQRLLDRLMAASAVLFYAGHVGGYYVRIGQPEGALWACHAGTLLIALGLLLASPRLNAVGASWLSLGTPLWLLDLAMGGELVPTSPLTHLGGLGVGCFGVVRLGFPAGTWWRALGGIVALQQLTRLLAPARGNVNVAFVIHPGWEAHFSSYGRYWLVMTAVAGGVFALAELAFRGIARLARLARSRRPRAGV